MSKGKSSTTWRSSECFTSGTTPERWPGEYKRRKWFMRFGATGSPDIICVIRGQFVGIEVKAPKGKQSDHKGGDERLPDF